MFAHKESKLRELANKWRASINDVSQNNVIHIISINRFISVNDIIFIDIISVINAWHYFH